MAIKVECDCGREIVAADDAGGKRVRCPECRALVRVPDREAFSDNSDVDVVEDVPASRRRAQAVADIAEEAEEEAREERKRAKKKKRRRRDEDEDGEPTSPFWRSRAGLILNGIGLIGLGAGGIGLYWFDKTRDTWLLIAGILCIGFGIGGVITGLTKPAAKSRRRCRDEEDE